MTVVDAATGRPVVHVRRGWHPPGAPAHPGFEQLIELVLPADALGLSPDQIDPSRVIPTRFLPALLRQARFSSTGPCTGAHERAAHDPTHAQQHFVRARDRHCCFPGCRRRAITCDLDHHIAWEQRGPTCACNLRPLCRHHHQAKQHTGWVLTLDAVTGTAVWTSPHGCRAGNDTHRLDPSLYELSSTRRQQPTTRPTTDPDAT